MLCDENNKNKELILALASSTILLFILP